MKTLVTCLLILFLNSLAVASQLVPLPINMLEENSKLIIIAKIKNVKLVKDSGIGGKSYKIDVEKISTLKGNHDVKNITFKFHKGGLKGFNIIPKENTFWIMFLRQINNNNGVLVHPRSMVKFAAYIRESGTVYRPNPVSAVVTPKIVDVKPKVAALVVQPKKPSSGHSLDNLTPYIVSR